MRLKLVRSFHQAEVRTSRPFEFAAQFILIQHFDLLQFKAITIRRELPLDLFWSNPAPPAGGHATIENQCLPGDVRR